MMIKVKKNVLLKPYTTLKIGGRARFFLRAKSEQDFVEAVSFAKKKRLKIFILGNGSNVLISDKGINGLVVKNDYRGIFFEKGVLSVKSGTLLSQVLNFCVSNGLKGLEWMVGIPGTMGGAVFGNAGAFGFSIKDSILRVKVLDQRDLKIKELKKEKLFFNYRDSTFKQKRNYIILEVFLKLKSGDQNKIKKKVDSYLKYKLQTQPLNALSAGCVFKNPPGVSAGKLIEDLGLKGEKMGKIMISPKHGNFFINLNNGKEKDFRRLISKVKSEAKKKFKIFLEEEIIFWR